MSEGALKQWRGGWRPVARDAAASVRAVPVALERAKRLDGLADRLAAVLRPVTGSQRLRDLLHGVWLGHPLHPLMVQVPVGAWLSGAVLDAVPGQRRAAGGLIALGTVAAVPAAAAGVNDWLSLTREQRRVGLVHAASNLVAVSLYGSSVAARLAGRHRAGRTLSTLGLLAASAGAYLGGHLSFSQAAAVNVARADLPMLDRDGWTDLGGVDEFPDGELVRRSVGPVPLLVYRDGATFSVLLERCAHQRGPLAEGSVTDIDGAACVVCPWHGSTFRLSDGVVMHGPAANSQPTLPSRVLSGRVQVMTEA
jgi:nitrite reductase/ring-hydroxylating ferredoxin subunit/uncharacterized membrane protein